MGPRPVNLLPVAEREPSAPPTLGGAAGSRDEPGASASEGGSDPLSRPLPSVDMPLLRGQVRAERAKRLALGIALGVGALGALAFAILGSDLSFGGDEEEPEAPIEEPAALATGPLEPLPEDALFAEEPLEAVEPEEPPPPPEPEPVESEDGLQRFETQFGDALGFRPALVAAGLSSNECADVEQALDGVLDFRRCRPEDRIVYERDPAGELVGLEYHDEATSYVVVQRDDEGALEAERVERELETQRVARSGVVRTSLGDAIENAGLGRTLVGVFVEVFDGKVNCSTQARAGDRFRVLVEEERLEGEFLRWGQVHALEYTGQRAGELRAFWFHPRGQERGNWYDETGRELRGSWLRVPCRYDRISSPFDPRRMHPILRRIHPHNGVDFAASTGTPVWAAADGTVTWAGPKGANGNLVSIRHEGGYMTHYAHLHRIQRGIRRGVRVDQRQLIGAVGTTGRSTGPHLHFGLKRNGRFLDPMEVLNGPGRMLPAGQLGRFRRRMRELRAELEAAGEEPAEGEERGG